MESGLRRPAPVYEKSSEPEPNLWTLEHPHLAQLEATGQVDEALAVLRQDLWDAHSHSKVIGCPEGPGRFREAFAQAEQSCKACPETGACRTISCGATSGTAGPRRRWRCGVSSSSAARA